jgi:glycosyltransferase involved in cell wall biosynthesis
LVKLMRQTRPHIVHTHTAKAGLVGRLAAFLTRVPVIVHTFHGHVFHGYFGAIKSRFFITLEQLVARITDAVVTISDGLREELIGYRIAPPARIYVVPLGLALDRFAAPDVPRGTLRGELGCSPEIPLVGMIGRLVPIKNHELLLEAALHVRRALPEAHFVIVGGGERLEPLQAAAAALGLSDAVSFTGWRRDLPAIYADLDVLALTSNNEGTPVSIIEAMAAGVPVVATAVGGVPDLLEAGALGTLVPPGDAAQFGQALVETLTQPQEHIGAARESALARYGAARLIGDMRALYRDLLAAKGIRSQH